MRKDDWVGRGQPPPPQASGDAGASAAGGAVEGWAPATAPDDDLVWGEQGPERVTAAAGGAPVAGALRSQPTRARPALTAVVAAIAVVAGFAIGNTLGPGTGDDGSESATVPDTSVAPADPLAAQGTCDLSADGDVQLALDQECAVSCAAAMAFADAATNPGLRDVLLFEVGYLRLTDLDGTELEAGETVRWGDAAVELLAVHADHSDPSAIERAAWAYRWGPTGLPAAEAQVIYDAYELIEQTEVADPLVTEEVVHPLRETAQYLLTSVGCVPNPHRATEASSRRSPPVPVAGTEGPGDPPAAETDTGMSVGAARNRFVELTRAACDASAVPDPAEATVVPSEDGGFLVEDAEGVALRLPPGAGEVTSTAGPDAVMPRPYSFACDPEVFVGTLEN